MPQRGQVNYASSICNRQSWSLHADPEQPIGNTQAQNIVNNMRQPSSQEYQNAGNLTAARLRINPPGYSSTRG